MENALSPTEVDRDNGKNNESECPDFHSTERSKQGNEFPGSHTSNGKKKKAPTTAMLKCVSLKDWHTSENVAIKLLAEEPPVSSGNESSYTPNYAHRDIVHLLEGETKHVDALTFPSRIRVMSESVRERLSEICCRNMGYYCDGLGTVTILRPFKIFEYIEPDIRARLAQLRQIQESSQTKTSIPDPEHTSSINSTIETDAETAPVLSDREKETLHDLECLISFVDRCIVPLKKALPTFNEVYFHELWHLFCPGSLLYVKDKAIPQKVWRVIQGTGGRRNLRDTNFRHPKERKKSPYETRCNPFALDCYYIDWNGTHYVRVQGTFLIQEFSDLQITLSLPFYL